MNPWLRNSAYAIVGVFALIGFLVVLVQIFGVPFVASCNRVVLARAVSPNGERIAEHVRLVCADSRAITHTIYVGTLTIGESYHGYQFYDGERQEGVGRIEPAVLWWESEDELSVIYPPGVDYVDGIEISGVTLRAATRRQLE